MTHGPATDWGEDRAAGRKARVGLWMFLVYALIYAGFVVINTLSPTSMETTVLGLSLSVVYGMGLIVLALVLALIYNGISGRAEARLNEAPEERPQ
jgi:uncharacterized membrane protein (DUF485 family)